jgi:hypothetical protein
MRIIIFATIIIISARYVLNKSKEEKVENYHKENS